MSCRGEQLYVQVDGADVPGLVLFDPQVSVLGRVHRLEQLVHVLYRLSTREKYNDLSIHLSHSATGYTGLHFVTRMPVASYEVTEEPQSFKKKKKM